MLQGANRLQRGLNYIAYLRHLVGAVRGGERERAAAHSVPPSATAAYEPMYEVFVGAHNNTAFFFSSVFLSWALGGDNAEEYPSRSAPLYGPGSIVYS